MDAQKILEIVLEIADGNLSVSRIKRIAKALYGVEIDPKLIGKITAEAGVATPHREPSNNPLENQYPDCWSILLEARSFWVRVRRYWGDSAASRLKSAIEKASVGRWRGLREQFEPYTTSAITERRDLNLTCVEILLPLELEALYSWELQRDLHLKAFQQEFSANPNPQPGAKFPLASPEWQEFKRKKFQEDCLKAFELQIGSEEKLIEFFADFWGEVYRNRGVHYFENLKHDLIGCADQPLSQRPFYSASEGNFRHWLRNLSGFKTKAPWRIVLMDDPDLPLPMPIEGALKKYGWRKVQSMVSLGILSANY